jgi:hypothetical protein
VSQSSAEIHLTKIEAIFMTGIVGCLLFATWELGHLMADEWFQNWVQANRFVRRRIILYGIAFGLALPAIMVAGVWVSKGSRFGQTVSRALLWYGTILLISTIAIFVFDCLPEVFAGFIGAIIFIVAIYFTQKKFFAKKRLAKLRLRKGQCAACGEKLPAKALYCPSCSIQVGKNCASCDAYISMSYKFCPSCGQQV